MSAKLHRKWIVSGDELLLSSESGCLVPSAEQVYEAIIENKKIFPDVPPGSPDYLGELSFSRYPAQLIIDIDYRPAEGVVGLFCEVKAIGGRYEVQVVGFRARKTDHIVIADKWYPFAVGALEQINEILDEANVQDSGEISFKSYMSLKKIAQDNNLVRDQTADQLINPGITVKLDTAALRYFNGALYPYQEDGWRWLNFLVQEGLGGILADEMGLGKTVQIIAALATPDRQSITPSLIIAPSTILENWRREIEKFSPTIRTLVHQGPDRTGLPAVLLKNDIVITSYDTVVRDGSLFGMLLWKAVVLDEAQAIKNPETKRALSVKALRRSVAIAVTGTPVENRLRDLWSIIDFILPGYLGSENDFECKFGNGPCGALAIEPFVSPLILRRRVVDVAQDLPEIIQVPQVLQFEQDESEAYEKIREGVLSEYGKSASLVALTKLRMFCAHPLLLEESYAETENPSRFTKFRRLLEIVEEIFDNSEKVIVFTSFNRMSDIIASNVSRHFDVFAEVIDGRTPVNERQKVIDTFSSVGGPALLVLNPRAAGVGLNITAANHVIHYNLEWNPAVEDQASARVYRLGQEKPVTIHRFLFADTVEDVVNERLERKREISDAAVVGVTAEDDEFKDIITALQVSPLSSRIK